MCRSSNLAILTKDVIGSMPKGPDTLLLIIEHVFIYCVINFHEDFRHKGYTTINIRMPGLAGQILSL